ncbi:ubiquitin-conjugating enzyme E2 E2-like [Cucurbita moschata]|uniref:Ubiquitin-conjugating enzyme E2 E2-like n=1 Tax=Cucurbita moschata TaxID=3662 RepID=A0A6J1HIF1_CUCMO|nr:ubiquitin-conjugating enzyme E2 E2-like [Cucurbita moschata]
MVLSRLCCCFSTKSSSSTVYTRFHTPPPPPPVPIIHGDYAQPKPAQQLPIPIVDEGFKQPEASPPRVPIIHGDYGHLNPAQQLPIPIVDEVSKQPEDSPPRVPIIHGDFGQPMPAQHLPIPTGDEGFKQPEASPPRAGGNSDGDGGDGSGNEEKTSAMYRIENELRAMNEAAATHCSFGPVGADILRCEGIVIGPAFSCYDGGIFHLSIQFPSNYPLSPPLIKFLTKIFHPNIEEDGTILIDILTDNWSPALTIETLMLSICSILSNPEPDEGSINEASRMFLNNWLNYTKIAREWTKQYAMGNPPPP